MKFTIHIFELFEYRLWFIEEINVKNVKKRFEKLYNKMIQNVNKILRLKRMKIMSRTCPSY